MRSPTQLLHRMCSMLGPAVIAGSLATSIVHAQPTFHFLPASGTSHTTPMGVTVTACDETAQVDPSTAEFLWNDSPIDPGNGEPAHTCDTELGWAWNFQVDMTSDGPNALETTVCDEDSNCTNDGAGWDCSNCLEETALAGPAAIASRIAAWRAAPALQLIRPSLGGAQRARSVAVNTMVAQRATVRLRVEH